MGPKQRLSEKVVSTQFVKAPTFLSRNPKTDRKGGLIGVTRQRQLTLTKSSANLRSANLIEEEDSNIMNTIYPSKKYDKNLSQAVVSPLTPSYYPTTIYAGSMHALAIKSVPINEPSSINLSTRILKQFEGKQFGMREH